MTPIVVLLVEDSGTIRALVRKMLVAGGHTVVEAADGAAALAACRAQQPDVVLLDVEMPGMSGWDVLTAMKADPDLSDVPVVFLTGRSGTADIVDGLRLGAHDYLRKPCEPTELLARVQAAARVKRLQDELRQRNEELDTISRTDALTNMHNRRHVEEYLASLTSLARRNAQPIAVLIIDIDHFKSVNDRHGHAAGDAVLREVAERMARSVRLEDMVGRWGGEEFLAILPMTSARGAAELAERLRRAVADQPCHLPDGSVVPVTISLGCAASVIDDAETLVRSADAAMYEAKARGRNRVVVAESDELPHPAVPYER
ncbi:MAG TPA: diguanylate cyclase [Actinomycetes bacterium]|jgi:diguanylate cyclase (GGDEF)-like protein|nr:diguanylate cyclase [Actinomycetes bacterium]